MATNWQQEFSSNSQPTSSSGGGPLSFLGDAYNKVQDVRNNIRGPKQTLTLQGGYQLPLTDIIDSATGSGLSMSGNTVPALEQKAGSLMGYLTKGGVGKKIGQAYEDATNKGITDTTGDLITELKQAVSQKLGNDPKYGNIINQRISSDVVGPSVEANPTITPSKEFLLKQQAANRLPNGFLSQFQGKSAGNQVDEILRDVAGKRAADITPGVNKLNKIYKAYSTVGSPARILGNYAISQAVPDEAKGYVGGDIGATGLFGILENLLKVGGKI